MESKLSPKPLSRQTIEEQTKKYLMSLTEEEIKKLLKEVSELKTKQQKI